MFSQSVLQKALMAVSKALQPSHLTDIQELVLRQSWMGKTYQEMADESGYSIQHIRDVGYQLWQLLSNTTGEKISKSNVQSVLAQWIQTTGSRDGNDVQRVGAHLLVRPLEEQRARNQLELPGSQVKINSPFYIERPPLEQRAYEEITKPGAIIRIKAPRQMGKTSLMSRILAHAAEQGYQTVRLNFQQAEIAVLNHLDRFLRWFCLNISRQLSLPPRLEDFWDEEMGSKVSCTLYFQEYLLKPLNSALVLALDEVDRIFEYPELAQDFLGLLRFWYEEANNLEVWQKLRVVIVHSTEVYIPLKINQSPFNVGLPIRLPEFSLEQVQELAQRHWLNWIGGTQAQNLMAMVGGHPYLVRLALYHLERQEVTLEQLLQQAPTQAGIYRYHLQRHLGMLQGNPELAIALNQVVSASAGVQLEPMIAYKLDSMGLVKLDGFMVIPSCELYRLYFRDYISSSSCRDT